MAQTTLSPSPNLQIEERDQAGQVAARYVTSGTSGRIDVIVPANSRNYIGVLLNAFLPAGYPQSVTEDYLEYQIYDSLQAFSSSIAGLLASRAVLEGVGVGDATASPTAAILLSVLQDSMGRIATILFAHKLGTALEPECKMYRLAADFFNDAAMILDCISPAFPKSSRVLLLSFSSALRAICGVTGSSSKASLSAHFAKQGNLAELNAKDSSQETIISLLGMLAGSLVVSRITSRSATWITLLSLLSVHLWTNYRAVRAVRMRTLNRQRANIVFSSYLQSLYDGGSHAVGAKSGPGDRQGMQQEHMGYKLLSPRQVSFHERIFERDGVIRWHDGVVMGHCALGVSFNDILNTLPLSPRHPVTGSYNSTNSEVKDQPSVEKVNSNAPIKSLLETFANEDYVLSYSTFKARFSQTRQLPRFVIALKEPSGTRSQLKSWFHAFVCARKLHAAPELLEGPMLSLLKETLVETRQCWPKIEEAMEETGWDLDKGALETRSGVRISLIET